MTPRSLRTLGSSLAAAAALVLLGSQPAGAWTKTYVIEWFEPAFYYGGPEGATSADAPGTDCPKGANPDNDWLRMLTTPYRSRKEVLELLDPELGRKRPDRLASYAKRGPHGEDVLTHPEVTPDPHILEVQGKIAYGFNLDGDEKTGFTSPGGEKGIDNAFYHASGCVSYWRGRPRDAAGFKYGMDGMRDGKFTMLIVLSGQQDPRNDPAAKIGFYMSPDKMVKDANGNVAPDYSYRIDADSPYQNVLDVRIENGVVETPQPVLIAMRDRSLEPLPMLLHQGRLRFEMKSDGSIYGLLGGYRDLWAHYKPWARPGRLGSGVIVELVAKLNAPGWWHAMQRRADGLPDPKTGKNTALSSAYHIYGIPAFVISPETAAAVTEARIFKPHGPAPAEEKTAAAEGAGER